MSDAVSMPSLTSARRQNQSRAESPSPTLLVPRSTDAHGTHHGAFDGIPSKWHCVGVPRTKTTIYIETELLAEAKVLAAIAGRREYEVIEDALRAYLAGEGSEPARRELRAMVDRWETSSGADPETT